MLRDGRTPFSKMMFILFGMFAIAMARPITAGSATPASPALLSEVLMTQAEILATIDSNATAMALFTTAIGPSLGLEDAANALGAKGLSAKTTKELGIEALSRTVYRLMASLSAWQLADSIRRSHETADPSTTELTMLPTPTRKDWMTDNSHLASLSDLFKALQDQRATSAEPPTPQSGPTALLLAANRTAFEASQQATIAWWELHQWKDRVRQAWGQARLCGTWQWVIHNHQNHQEQKTVVHFPPPGQTPANTLLPVETVILGDSIYLRWEQAGRIQEDSLLLNKDRTRIEGSFENNTGGWGSISGKRLTGCQS